MKIRDLYLEDFIKELEEKGHKITFNDNTGRYYCKSLGLAIKSWNNEIEFNVTAKTLEIVKIFLEMHNYYYEIFDEAKKTTE